MLDINQPNSRYRALLAVDFDDVLFDCNAALQRIIRSEFHSTSSYMEFVSKHPYLKNEIFRFLYGSYHQDCVAIDGAHDALSRLVGSHRMVVVTGRSESTRRQTEKWLEVNFPMLFSEIYFTNAFLGKNGESERKKSNICLDIGVDILIDDSVEETIDVSSVGVIAFLFDRPWNRTSVSVPLFRVNSWSHALNKLSNTGGGT